MSFSSQSRPEESMVLLAKKCRVFPGIFWMKQTGNLKTTRSAGTKACLRILHGMLSHGSFLFSLSLSLPSMRYNIWHPQPFPLLTYSPKSAGTCTSGARPSQFTTKRPTLTGPRLHLNARPGQPPGFSRDGGLTDDAPLHPKREKQIYQSSNI
jgi:hypothetical protein